MNDPMSQDYKMAEPGTEMTYPKPKFNVYFTIPSSLKKEKVAYTL